MKLKTWVAVAALAALSACGAKPGGKNANVDEARLLKADSDTDNWLSYGRTHDEQRFSPLTDVNDTNVSQLGLEYFVDMDTARGQEATPIVVDGIMYVSTAWSMVKAYDATTGKPLWSYDPKVPREKLVDVCCDAVNRGVAVYKGRVYVATLAGDVVALNADTGAELWKVRSIPKDSHMAITGAPRIIKGNVVIGSAGSEYFTRGYLAAFNAETGKEAWRFYTVPGDPSKAFEGKHLEDASKTWAPDAWKRGGGGTVWDSITYDPETDLIYFGTANAEPWNPEYRGTNGKGDSLYTASIVAVKPETGEYVWHFQETPEDRWDFDSNQHIIAATVPINGKPTRVVMHAPKNGFFYTLDAKTGTFISGGQFAKVVNWASGLDPVTGKPNVLPEAKYELTRKPFIGMPGALGAHSWQPMSYSPTTGLVYIPESEAAQPYFAATEWKPTEDGFQLGLDNFPVSLPADAKIRAGAVAATTGNLIAWDPVAQKARWTVPYPAPSNGGTLATAGNLVFQGTAAGELRAYSADKGKQLWSFPTQTGVLAAPITYRVKGVQYVAVLAGWGGVMDVAPPGIIMKKIGIVRNISRLLVFRVGGKATLPAPPPDSKLPLDPPPFTGKPEQVVAGGTIYANTCAVCHGDTALAGVLNPDLRHSVSLSNPKLWQEIVHDGTLKDNGMIGWSKSFNRDQIESIRHYIIKRANEDKALEGGGKKVAVR